MKELRAAILAEANGDAVLSAAIDSDIYFDHVPGNEMMPWITFHFISEVPIHVFRKADTHEEAIVQFSVFDQNTSVLTCGTIASDLTLVFDRAELTYATHTHVGCLRDGGTGPTFYSEDKVWMQTIDYKIQWLP